MVRDNVVFRITVDGKQAEQTFRTLEAQVKKLGGTIDRVNPKTQQLGAGISNAGNNAAASAVNFQTATQGMLNLSTAAVQTYTSISNLDRANNRAKQSLIAVARAEDLLNNKTERLNQLQKSGTASAQQLANMQREIATATADLTVKQEKAAIEQAAVNDVYMLFATNVANVTISSLQTIGVLLGQERMARLASTAATKLHSLATWDNVMAQRANLAGLKALPGFQAGATLSQKLATVATKAQTLALHGLKIALGPIGLIFIGVSAAMVAYETNALGLKDTINSLIGVQDDFGETLKESRLIQDDFNDGLEQQHQVSQKMPDTFRKMSEAVKQYRVELLAATIVQKQTITDAQVLEGIARATELNRLTTPPLDKGGAKPPFNFFGIKFPELFQPAFAETQGPLPPVQGPGLEPISRIFEDPQMQEKADRYFTMTDILMAQSAEFDRAIAALINEQIIASGGIPKSTIQFPGLKNLGFPKDTLLVNTQEIRRLSFLKEGQLSSFISKADRAGELGSFINRVDPKIFTGKIMDGKILDPKTKLLVSLAKAQREEYLPNEKDDELFQFLGKRNLIGTSTTFGNKFLKVLRGGDQRADILLSTGMDIGAVANILPQKEAERIAGLEKAMSYFANVTGGLAGGAEVFLAQQGKQWRQQQVANAFAGRAGFGTGFFKSTGATAAFQVPKGSIKVPGWVRDRQVQQDLNLNRLKTGGQRVGIVDPLTGEFQPSFQIWEEGAVEGGFTSIRSARAFWRREFNRNAREAESFLSQLGRKIGGGYTARNSASVAIGQVAEMKGLLSRTGLSLSALPTRGDFMPRRGGGGLGNVGNMYGAMMANISRQHNEAVSRTIAANQLTLKRAGEIDILQGGFGLTGFFGSALSLQELQLKTAQQDALIQSIGLNRTEAFKIIDTQGRGRNEIDDRVRWTQRNDSISTGASVL